MKQSTHTHLKEVQRAIALMPKMVKEQELRYVAEIKFAKKTFQSVIREILRYQKSAKV